MSKATKPAPSSSPAPLLRWSYTALADHLGVSRRTLIRYVVSGSIPSPTRTSREAYWSGDALELARTGPSLPGTFDYDPGPVVTRRKAVIAQRQKSKTKPKATGGATTRATTRATKPSGGKP